MAIVMLEPAHVCRMVNICVLMWLQLNIVIEAQISDVMKSRHLCFFIGAQISSVKFSQHCA